MNEQVAFCLQLYIRGTCKEEETDVVLAIYLRAQKDLQNIQRYLQKETVIQEGVSKCDSHSWGK